MTFWDLIQPFFMFIVGVAIALSVNKRTARGDNYSDIRNHAIKRSIILLVLVITMSTLYKIEILSEIKETIKFF